MDDSNFLIHLRTLFFSTEWLVEAVSYPEAWPGTTVCYSTNVEDPDSWKRNLDTFYMGGKLSWEHVHTKNGSIFFRYVISSNSQRLLY